MPRWFFFWFLLFPGSPILLNAQSSSLVFATDFEEDVAGEVPRAGWTSLNGPAAGDFGVVFDEEDLFGRGPNQKYLRARDVNSFTLLGNLSEPQEVVTLRLRIIGRNTPADNRWLQFNILAGNGLESADRAHVFSLDLINQRIRNLAIPYGENDEVLDISVIVNNSPSVVTYAGRSGMGTYFLGSRQASVWVNGIQTISSYNFGRGSNGNGPIRAISLQADTDAVVSFDLALLMVFNHAVVVGNFSEPPPPPPPVVPMVSLGEDGRLEYTEDAKGNRIPDFSNAGYRGGGVPIPDVPVKRTLSPQPGDNRARIQAAIDEVSAMPIGSDGFRGAVLLKAGQYDVGNTLRISAAGVVLRGEGDGPDGTILRATRRAQHTLIQVGGTGSWSEVSGTRRQIIDPYVPVGARSFSVADSSGYQVGDAIIVHRPSTAAWISAIGMDQIPPRSDGLPVTQWAPGSRDLLFDRIITAIDGNTITIDAPLVNALEAEFGGGSIYRYTFAGRIAQVGIERIRGVSVFEGGPWKAPGQSDENHAWTFIDMDRVQNAWVRNTTAFHFGFGNTMVSSRAKWVTVQDSQNLEPVSTISGSRRYPFYIQGQLSLVQRCYANYARHDYGTSSGTFGPNVFLDSSGEHSSSDTGPHHRWAVGTLYDNIRVPHRDIAVQNRLNYGSGHGWAGANHVVWNSLANRIVVQNPPTAQNWAIGVIGSKWAGAFPNHAEDGYWVSHGVPVEPRSLYLKQLEDRLAPEGTGGAISIVSFSEETQIELKPGQMSRISVTRRGNLDGPVWALVSVEGDDPERIEIADSVFIGARQINGVLSFHLNPDLVLGDPDEVTLRLLHGIGYSVGAIATAQIGIPGSPFGNWRSEHFSAEQRNDPLISGPEAAPAGDGVENLLKYALNLDPFEVATAADLPKMQVSDGRLTLSFDRGADRTDIEYLVEVSSDLVHWESGEKVTEEIDGTGYGNGNWKRVIIADLTPVEGSERRFLRLRVKFTNGSGNDLN